MKFSRRAVLAAAGASAAVPLRWAAGAAEYSFKMANDSPADHPLSTYAVQAINRIKQETGGRIEIRFFANSVLGGQVQMLEQTRIGAIDFLQATDGTVGGLVPLSNITATPFAFSTYKDIYGAMDGGLGKAIRSAVVNAKTNLYPFERSWAAGFREMVTVSRPINVPDDLKGLKMRIPPAPMPVTMFKAFGAQASPVNAAERYTALQTHLVDGLDQPLTGLDTAKLYEVTKYIAMTNHSWTGYFLYANADTWQRLPKDLRAICERLFDASGNGERDEFARTDASTEAELRSKGMIFNRPNPAPFKAVLSGAGLYKQWRENFGAENWGILERAGGTLT